MASETGAARIVVRVVDDAAMSTVSQLEHLVRAAWGPDTCDPHALAKWCPENAARGQCGATALVVQDLLGGHLVLGEVHEDGVRQGWHYWNRLPDGVEIDLTREQFGVAESVTAGKVVQRPDDAPRRCRGQYELLRHRVVTRLRDVEQVGDQPGPPIRIALVLLRDPAGSVLLHLRDREAQAEPGQWSLPGGHVEDGEDHERAARRELAEETGLSVEGELRLFWRDMRPDLTGSSAAVEVHVYAGRCAAVSTEVAVEEGQAAVFVPVADLVNFDLSPTAAAALAGLLTNTPST